MESVTQLGTRIIHVVQFLEYFRFLDPKGGALKRYPPNTILHYYNAPPGYNEDDLKQAIEEQGAVVPDVVKVLGSKSVILLCICIQ